MSYNQKKSGFTIVELLIVVVVIAILAAITIVAYNGIRQRADVSSLKSELSQAVKKIESVKVLSGTETYPSSQAAAGLPESRIGTLSYIYSAADNTYCVQLIKDATSYFSNSDSKNPSVGSCSESNLVGWWKLNGDSVDSSGKGNNGTGYGTTQVTGENGQANGAYGFTFDANSSVTIPSSTSINTDLQTFSIWVNPTDWLSPSASVLMAKRDVDQKGFFMAYIAATNTLAFDCGSTSQRWATGYVPPFAVWTHIAFTCSLDGTVIFYVNGVKQGTKTGANRSTISTSAPLRIGRDSNDSIRYNINGSLDDARLYNRVLNDSEIQLLYSSHAK
jgi:prepilin-type N-terminal cleavage/methylation domain-containing protein